MSLPAWVISTVVLYRQAELLTLLYVENSTGGTFDSPTQSACIDGRHNVHTHMSYIDGPGIPPNMGQDEPRSSGNCFSEEVVRPKIA